MRQHARRGFTLVELAVVMAIVLVLLGLLLVAVQQTRRMALRTASANNLRMISLAFHTYDASYGVLPGTGRFTHEGLPVAFFEILPQLEAQDLYQQFSLEGSTIIPPANSDLGPGQVVKVYLSPADATPPGPTFEGKGLASYTPNPSVLGEGSSLMKSFPDGLANTILLGERIRMCAGIPNEWFSAGPRDLVFGAAPDVKNFNPIPSDCNPERPSSPDPNGILISLADGSTRFVTYDLALENWSVACDPSDGIDLPQPW